MNTLRFYFHVVTAFLLAMSIGDNVNNPVLAFVYAVLPYGYDAHIVVFAAYGGAICANILYAVRVFHASLKWTPPETGSWLFQNGIHYGYFIGKLIQAVTLAVLANASFVAFHNAITHNGAMGMLNGFQAATVFLFASLCAALFLYNAARAVQHVLKAA